jgi:glycine C-acetyltransferase/8-amino-7-oxononanoate synthase
VFAHNDLDDLEAKLKWAREQTAGPAAQRRILVVTESVFSMDGDNAPLAEIIALKEKYGAWLMVDEAHATGLYGTNRRGLAEELGVSERIEIQMGTLGKALGASGGYICGSRSLINFLINQARSLIFSTAPIPAAAAMATTAIQLVQSKEGEQRSARLWRHLHRLHSAFRIPRSVFKSAILPVIIGDEAEALSAAAGLLDQGVFVPAIRFPTVGRGTARLRITLSAAHSEAEVDRLAAGVSSIVNLQTAIAHASARQT